MMSWDEVGRYVRHGAELVFTNDIPGGYCFALRQRSSPNGRPRLIKVREAPSWTEATLSPNDARAVRAALEMVIARG